MQILTLEKLKPENISYYLLKKLNYILKLILKYSKVLDFLSVN